MGGEGGGWGERGGGGGGGGGGEGGGWGRGRGGGGRGRGQGGGGRGGGGAGGGGGGGGGREGEGGGEGEGEGEGGTPLVHTADQDMDHKISLPELLRIIQFYNSGGFHCRVGTEDGYAPGLGDTVSCAPHASDYAPQDWKVGLTELLRLIQFFNLGGYHACPESDPPTEDGYCPRVG